MDFFNTAQIIKPTTKEGGNWFIDFLNAFERLTSMKFFRDPNEPEPEEPPPEPLNRSSIIGYTPGLVRALKRDHEELLQLHAELTRHADGGDWFSVQRVLLTFKEKYQAYLVRENARLFPILKTAYAVRPDILKVIEDDFQRANNSIAVSVSRLGVLHRNIATDATRRESFKDALRILGNIMKGEVKKIKTTIVGDKEEVIQGHFEAEKERLFPLY